MHYKSKKEKNGTINYVKVKRASDQRSLGFRVGHCHMQLA